jgi:uncharacterized protein (TIGR03435 family)
MALRRCLILPVVVLFAATPLWAHPGKGTLAPSLNSLQLLQAPAGARADWESLRGKVVVLEFWATWCSPCIASLPHLNQLVASLDPAKFQFLSIDDEDTKAVQRFLSRKKMSGWVGIDNSSKVFARYGVNARPTTIIVDGDGKVAAVTQIESVTAAALRSVAERKNVAFKPAMEIVSSSAAAPRNTAARPLFEVSITPAASNAVLSQLNHPPTGTDLLGSDADSLFATAFNIFGGRYVLKAPLPDGRYDLRTNFVDVPYTVSTSAVQQAVLAALHLQVQPKTITGPAYILRSTKASGKLLSRSASTQAVKRGYWHNTFILMNGTMDDLAYLLATSLEKPVINETGIDGNFDARFQVAGGDIVSLNAVLQKDMGLELVSGDQQRSITVQEVSPVSRPPDLKHQ